MMISNEFSLFGYATVTTGQGTLIIGGHPLMDIVACYNRSGWHQLDRLQSSRQYHRAIINGDEVFIVGGFDEQ